VTVNLTEISRLQD